MTALQKIPRLALSGLFLAWAAAFCLPAAAFAQGPPCGPRSAILKMLGERFHEVVVGQGVIGRDNIGQLYVSRAGTWTLITTRADGQTCIIAAGKGWEIVTPDFIDMDPES